MSQCGRTIKEVDESGLLSAFSSSQCSSSHSAPPQVVFGGFEAVSLIGSIDCWLQALSMKRAAANNKIFFISVFFILKFL
jgi:hypothetical protein